KEAILVVASLIHASPTYSFEITDLANATPSINIESGKGRINGNVLDLYAIKGFRSIDDLVAIVRKNSGSAHVALSKIDHGHLISILPDIKDPASLNAKSAQDLIERITTIAVFAIDKEIFAIGGRTGSLITQKSQNTEV